MERGKRNKRLDSVQSDSAILDNKLIRRVKSEVSLIRAKSLNFKSKCTLSNIFLKENNENPQMQELPGKWCYFLNFSSDQGKVSFSKFMLIYAYE